MNTGKDGHGMVLVVPQATVVSLGVDPMLLDLDLLLDCVPCYTLTS